MENQANFGTGGAVRRAAVLIALVLTGCGLADLNEALDNSEPEPAKVATPADSIPADTLRGQYPDLRPVGPR